MRQLMNVCAAAGLLWGAGCKPPPKEQAVEMFQKDVQRYFNELNREALDRKDRVRSELDRSMRNPQMDPATGTVYSTFAFDPQGYVVENYKCQSCGTVLALPAAEAEMLCRSCGHSPYRSHTGVNKTVSPCPTCSGADGKLKPMTEELVSRESLKLQEGAAVKEMFELTADNPEKPLVATVRYVRRLWVFDPRGAVKLTQAAQNKAAVDMTWLPTEGAVYDYTTPTSKYSLPGFHRLDGVYLGEIVFQWKGGTLTEKSRAAETPVRPWKDLTTVGK